MSGEPQILVPDQPSGTHAVSTVTELCAGRLRVNQVSVENDVLSCACLAREGRTEDEETGDPYYDAGGDGFGRLRQCVAISNRAQFADWTQLFVISGQDRVRPLPFLHFPARERHCVGGTTAADQALLRWLDELEYQRADGGDAYEAALDVKREHGQAAWSACVREQGWPKVGAESYADQERRTHPSRARVEWSDEAHSRLGGFEGSVHEVDGKHLLVIRGSMRAVLVRCCTILIQGDTHKLSEVLLEYALVCVEAMKDNEGRGAEVICYASCWLPEEEVPPGFAFEITALGAFGTEEMGARKISDDTLNFPFPVEEKPFGEMCYLGCVSIAKPPGEDDGLVEFEMGTEKMSKMGLLRKRRQEAKRKAAKDPQHKHSKFSLRRAKAHDPDQPADEEVELYFEMMVMELGLDPKQNQKLNIGKKWEMVKANKNRQRKRAGGGAAESEDTAAAAMPSTADESDSEGVSKLMQRARRRSLEVIAPLSGAVGGVFSSGAGGSSAPAAKPTVDVVDDLIDL